MRSSMNLLVRAGVFAVILAAMTSVGRAEDVKGKWYLGGNLGVLVTTDNIRSNAALIIAPLGADGAPFTGDKGEVVSCQSDPNRPATQGTFCDPRPDELLARQTMLQQTWKLDATVGYGLTSNFSIQLDTGYYQGNVNNFDVFTTKSIATSHNPSDPCLMAGMAQPCNLTAIQTVEIRHPISAGMVTEIPLMLTGIVRFRKDSNFNPYIGGGAGYIFTSVNEDPEVSLLNRRLQHLRIIDYTDEFGATFGRVLSRDPNTGLPLFDPNGQVRFTNPVSVSVDRGIQYHLAAGAEYFFNDKVSLLFDARYVLSNNNAISILMRGEDQIDIRSYPEEMFRKDGSLRVFNRQGNPPNPYKAGSTTQRYNCDTDGDGIPNFGRVDYDGDGHNDDACFNPAPGVTATPDQQVVIQGGKIRLTAFTFAFGVRFHF